MTQKYLFTFHAAITLAAGVVLIVAPSLIPSTVNIELQPGQYLLCYFLAAAEIALAYLSYYGRKINDPVTVRLITVTIIIFHFVTLILELYALYTGVSSNILVNVAARVIIIGLFYYYGILKQKKAV